MLQDGDQAVKFCSFFTQKPGPDVTHAHAVESSMPQHTLMRWQEDPTDEALGNDSFDADDGICHGYLLDKSDDELQNDEWNDLEDDTPQTDHRVETPTHPTSSTNIIPPPAQKQQKLDVPAHIA